MPNAAIVKRYTGEAPDANLSCGGNLEFLDLQPGERVLDLGCGSGRETILCAQAVGGSGFVWGLDLTPRMLELAEKQAQAQGVANIEFLLGTMEKIPLPEASVDAVLSNCAINHAPDKARVYREIWRVLKTGGRFVVSDIMTEYSLPDAIRQDPEMVAACFGGAITLAEYAEALAAAGFASVEVLKERHYVKNGYAMISRTLRGVKKT